MLKICQKRQFKKQSSNHLHLHLHRFFSKKTCCLTQLCTAFLVGRNVLKMLQKRKPLKQMKPQSLWCTVPFQRFWGPGPHFHPHGRGAGSPAAVTLSSLLGLGSGVLDSFSWFSPLKRCSSAVAQSSMTSLQN